MKEPWFRGEPELEVHIQGPRETGSPTSGIDLSCSGEHAYEYAKVFNQDGGFWEGRVLLFSEAETVAFNNNFQQGFHVFFWEDDNEPCVLKLDTHSLGRCGLPAPLSATLPEGITVIAMAVVAGVHRSFSRARGSGFSPTTIFSELLSTRRAPDTTTRATLT